MHTVTAWKCEHTDAIYERQGDAARSEFRALMRVAGGKLPAMPAASPGSSVSAYDIMDWLGGNLRGSIYPTAFDALKEAMDYLEAHRDLLK